MTYYVKYDLTTGNPTQYGECPASQVSNQASEGQGVVAVERDPRKPISLPDGQTAFVVDIEVVREALLPRVDQQAGAVRSLYITDVPGQAQTYEKKEAEARLYTEGSAPSSFPFMNEEATLRGVPIAQVQAEILAQVNLLTPLAAKIEAHRINAKLGVRDATNIKQMVEAATINWNAALAPSQ